MESPTWSRPDEDLWRHELGQAFNQLAPERLGDAPLDGHLAGRSLGALLTYEVSGRPQIVRRTDRAVRQFPSDLLKICVQIRGRATVRQGEHDVVIRPGGMALYDTGKPYTLRLEDSWLCAVLAFPRRALGLPEHDLVRFMDGAHSLTEGPGAVLASFVRSVADQRDAIADHAATRLGEAGLSLLAGTIALPSINAGAAADDATRLQVRSYVSRHLGEPGLTHTSVAAAHHMSGRTLNRLFAAEPDTVTDLIRRLRLEAVRRDICDPSLNRRGIAVLAARWCFPDQSHFSRLFRAEYGFPPSQLRHSEDG